MKKFLKRLLNLIRNPQDTKCGNTRTAILSRIGKIESDLLDCLGILRGGTEEVG